MTNGGGRARERNKMASNWTSKKERTEKENNKPGTARRDRDRDRGHLQQAECDRSRGQPLGRMADGSSGTYTVRVDDSSTCDTV